MTHGLEGLTVVVTGAGGFIGPHVVASLFERGAFVRAIAGAPGQRVSDLPHGVEALFVDVLDSTALRGVVLGADVVAHMAGPASVRDSLLQPTECIRTHVGGTVSALDAARLAGVKRFVFVSSAEVYGRPHASPVTEDDPLEPRSPYGAAKAAAEFAARAYCASFGLTCVVLRPFSIYGPGVAPASLVGTIARQVRAGEPAVRLADLRPVRDYCFVDDLADAIARACIADVSGYTVVNIGSGEGTSVAALAARAIRAAGIRSEVVEDAGARRQESAEIFDLVADVAKARAILGWSATTSLDDGLAATIQAGSKEPA